MMQTMIHPCDLVQIWHGFMVTEDEQCQIIFHHPISTHRSSVVDHRNSSTVHDANFNYVLILTLILGIMFNQEVSRNTQQLSHSGEYTPSATNK